METGFFKWVWRFNALTIALAATGVVILLAGIVISDVLPRLTREPARNVVNIEGAATAEIKRTFNLGRFQSTGTAGILRAPLTTSQENDRFYGSGSGTYNNTINMLFVDPATGESRWLIEAGHALIRHHENLSRTFGPEDAQTHIPYATIYLVVTDDTSGDHRLSKSDRADLMIAAPDGTGLETLIPDVRTIEQAYELDDATELLVFTDSVGQHMAYLDLASLKITNTVTLPIPRNTE